MDKYYEFNNHEYYAIIKAENQSEALEHYLYYMARESLDEILKEGNPDEISALKALEIYGSTAPKGTPFMEVLESFMNEEDLIVIDGSLA